MLDMSNRENHPSDMSLYKKTLVDQARELINDINGDLRKKDFDSLLSRILAILNVRTGTTDHKMMKQGLDALKMLTSSRYLIMMCDKKNLQLLIRLLKCMDPAETIEKPEVKVVNPDPSHEVEDILRDAQTVEFCILMKQIKI